MDKKGDSWSVFYIGDRYEWGMYIWRILRLCGDASIESTKQNDNTVREQRFDDARENIVWRTNVRNYIWKHNASETIRLSLTLIR